MRSRPGQGIMPAIGRVICGHSLAKQVDSLLHQDFSRKALMNKQTKQQILNQVFSRRVALWNK